MNPVDRRFAVKLMLGSSAVGASVAASTAPPAPCAASTEASAPTFALFPPPLAAPQLATVSLCRSWDDRVHLRLDDGRCGLVQLTPAAFAIAVACELARQPVAVHAFGHDPRRNDGLGHFDGALLATAASLSPWSALLPSA
jgi:hypothetical protein